MVTVSRHPQKSEFPSGSEWLEGNNGSYFLKPGVSEQARATAVQHGCPLYQAKETHYLGPCSGRSSRAEETHRTQPEPLGEHRLVLRASCSEKKIETAQH